MSNKRLIPDGPADMDCPHWRKPMSKVCKRCPLWTEVTRTFKDEAKGTTSVDKVWECGLAQNVINGVEIIAALRDIAKRLQGNQAATESMRNQIVSRMDGVRPAPTAHEIPSEHWNGAVIEDKRQ